MLFNRVKPFFKQRFNRWLKKRMPAAAEQRLSNKNIFILPSKFGLAYVLSVLVLFLLGTNYQNNLIILMSYLFSSLFLTTMMYSFFNMSRLQFIFNSQITSYAEQTINIPLTVHTKNQRFDISFAFEGNTNKHESVIEVGESSTEIPFKALTRGVNDPGRLKVSSEYPFGLFTCWTHLDFDCEVITYPAKKAFNHIKQSSAALYEEVNGNKIVEGGDDFGELREYKQGESNAQIAWKQLARGQGLLTKTTQQELGNTIWLNLKQLPSATIEIKLEMLCFLILDHHKHNIPFGLDLNTVQISPSMGNKHVLACLKALALYGKPQRC